MATGKKKPSDAEQVELYMANLNHPLKPEVEELRAIIKSASPEIQERIKWNAPSYYCREDLLTFAPMRASDKVLLVFHHPYIVQIASNLLEGDYKDRRLAYFTGIEDILEKRDELLRIIRELLAGVK